MPSTIFLPTSPSNSECFQLLFFPFYLNGSWYWAKNNVKHKMSFKSLQPFFTNQPDQSKVTNSEYSQLCFMSYLDEIWYEG